MLIAKGDALIRLRFMLTWVEINAKALLYNIRAFKKIVGKKTLLLPVIKSNAYGHGFWPVARICQQSREVDGVCVASLDEALVLRNNKFSKSILVLAILGLKEKNIAAAVRQKIALPFYALEQAAVYNRVGERLKHRVALHLKIDTGTSRIGVLPTELKKFILAIKKYRYLKIEGMWSHLSSSEENAAVTRQQIRLFKKALRIAEEERIRPRLKHLACSAAAALYPDSIFNAVRVGLGIYGLFPSAETKSRLVLRPALSWHTTILQVKQVPARNKISYGGTYTTKRATTLAILPVGYWDGYDRRFSNQASVIIRGQRCPVLGRVCMNLMMVDATDVPEVGAGDKVTLIGRQGKEEVGADELAKIAGTINYEIVTRINPLIPRIVV